MAWPGLPGQCLVVVHLCPLEKLWEKKKHPCEGLLDLGTFLISHGCGEALSQCWGPGGQFLLSTQSTLWLLSLSLQHLQLFLALHTVSGALFHTQVERSQGLLHCSSQKCGMR